MEWMLDFFLFKNGSNILLEEVSFIFSIVIIFGLIFLFFGFILKMWKYYWETMRPMLQQEKRNDEKSVGDYHKETFKMIVELHDKIGDLTSHYAGKYATKNDLREIRKKVDITRDDVNNIKGQLGI